MQQSLLRSRAAMPLLALMASVLSACAGWPGARDGPLGEEDYGSRLAVARGFMSETRLTAALQALRQLARDYPQRPEAAYLAGECLYRMRDWNGAQTQLEAVRAAHRDFWPAVHRLWLVRLARDPATRHQIEEEIAALLDAAATPEALLTAYQGYRYLRDTERRHRVLERLVPRASGLQQRTRIATALLEEILGAPPSSQKARLAELYLDYFADQRGIGLAARTYVGAQGTWDADRARALVARYPHNRHLAQALAERLLDHPSARRLAERLLDEHVRLWRRAQVSEANWYVRAPAWRTLIRWEIAHTDYLRGLLAQGRGQPGAAQVFLEGAAAQHPEPWRVLAALASNAAGDPEAELRYRALALAAGDPSPQASGQLEKQFPHWRTRTRLPGVTPTSARFADVTTTTGLARYRAQRVAWGDYDNDGFADLLLDGQILLRNMAGRGFEDTGLADGVPTVGRATGGIWGDADNDGYLDVLITRRNDNRLLRNEQGRGFTDITARVFDTAFAGRTEAAAWGDIDNDGWIDLYTANYEEGGLERGVCRADQLFRNLGDGRFTDYSLPAKVVTDEPHCGRGVTWSDIDQDGYQDILVSNYRLDPNLLWKNRAGVSFVDVAGRWGFRGRNDGGAYGHSIGSVAGDLDGNQRIDVYVSNLAHPRYLDVSDMSSLLSQETAGVFADRFAESGIRFDETSADPLLADFDNDGDLDLYVTSIYPRRVSHLYQNQGAARFSDITAYSGTRVGNGWGAAAADYDHDGYLDLVVASRDGIHLFRNLGGTHHWLTVRVRSRVCNHFGIGARIQVEYGGKTVVREVTAGRGTGSQDPFSEHFGLGDHDGPVDVTVRHLCGQVERRRVESVDRVIEFR